ncbi:MAG: response regulator [Myxococcales bacterium]|nr:response regulator [Myxococcales bacterium]
METEPNKTRLEAAARTIAASRPRHRRVLLIESNPDLQWSLARMLTVNGNRVIGTGSVDGALAVLEQWAPDLAIVGSSLPGTTGVEVARQLREQNPDLFVILTGEHSPEPTAKERWAAASAELPRALGFETLRALLESLQLTPAPAE